MESLPFDAAEKLLEIEVRRGSGSLRALEPHAVSSIVEAGGGSILGSAVGRLVDAYVLSESSLFVRERSLSLLTCGRTDLGRSFEAFVDSVGAEAVASVRLSRERDRFPASAGTHFEDDVERIARFFDAEVLESTHGPATLRSFQSGELSAALDFRIFCVGLSGEARRVFLGDPRGVAATLAAIDAAFPAELSQVHHFEPSGFSMNLAQGEVEVCVHVSPEPTADVASVESSATDPALRLALLDAAERIFRPGSISVTLDGRRLVGATEARARLVVELERSGDARVV